MPTWKIVFYDFSCSALSILQSLHFGEFVQLKLKVQNASKQQLLHVMAG